MDLMTREDGMLVCLESPRALMALWLLSTTLAPGYINWTRGWAFTISALVYHPSRPPWKGELVFFFSLSFVLEQRCALYLCKLKKLLFQRGTEPPVQVPPPPQV